MKRKPSRTSIVMARRWRAATVLAVIVLRAEIVVDAAEGRAAAGVIADAAVAVDDPVVVAAAGVIVDAAARAGEDIKNHCHGFTRIKAKNDKS